MDFFTLICFIAVFCLSLVGFKVLDGQDGFLGLLHGACFMGLFITVPFLLCGLLAWLLEVFVEHKADRTRHFCPQCGNELFPEQGWRWSNLSAWKCKRCGASSDGIRSAIKLPPNCWPATRQAILKKIEELECEWDERNAKASPPKNRPTTKSDCKETKQIKVDLTNVVKIPNVHFERQKAAELGYAPAQYKIGSCYAIGYGSHVNYALAVKWYKLAAEQGNDDARFALDWCFAKVDSVDQKEIAAVGLYRAAAKQGDAVAQNNLAGCYLLGLGVEPDFAETAKWCRLAAEQGLAEAQNNYALCLYHGHGVAQDYTEAFYGFLMSAKQGFSEAQCNVGWCYDSGKGIKQDFKLAAEWYLRAAEQGNSTAQGGIGLCYEMGEGVPKNIDDALKWYRKAAAQGDDKAKQKLLKLTEDDSIILEHETYLEQHPLLAAEAGSIYDVINKTESPEDIEKIILNLASANNPVLANAFGKYFRKTVKEWRKFALFTPEKYPYPVNPDLKGERLIRVTAGSLFNDLKECSSRDDFIRRAMRFTNPNPKS